MPSPLRGPRYSSTNPRPHKYWRVAQRTSRSLDHIQKESSHYSGYVREPIPDPTITALLSSASSEPVPACKLTLNPQNPSWQLIRATTGDVFRDPTILPFRLPFGPDEAPLSKSLLSKLGEYAQILRGYQQLTRPRLYRVRYNFFVDELGRQYFTDSAGYLKFAGGSKFGDGRTERSITDNRPGLPHTQLSLALYAWNGLAGLSSVSKARILESKAFDFHHGNENLFDIRPCAVYPIPSFLHRYIHSVVPSYNDLVKFFT